MSLAEASEARKARLLALRKRRAGEGDLRRVACGSPRTQTDTIQCSEPILSTRNFDPETRTLRKRPTGQEEEDTVEKAVDRLAERILAEDESRRAQDLVCYKHAPSTDIRPHIPRRIYSTLHPNDRTGILNGICKRS